MCNKYYLCVVINKNSMDISRLVKVSTYANMIGVSVELIRLRIRTGKYRENKEYVKIDGYILINLDNVEPKSKED